MAEIKDGARFFVLDLPIRRYTDRRPRAFGILDAHPGWSNAHLIAVSMILIFSVGILSAATIDGSKHDLSSNATKSGDQSPCTYCHGAHGADGQAALWGRTDPDTTFTVYSSPTLNATMPQPGGISRGCLSCHDGVTAFDAINGSTGAESGNNMTTNYPGSSAIFGFDLSDDHPVGVQITADSSGIESESTIVGAGLKVYSNKVECGSCHDGHGVDGYDYFLRIDISAGSMCHICHSK